MDNLSTVIIACGSHSSVLDYINPLKYMSQDQYILIWQHLFATILSGFWARLLASASLFLAFFIGVYRQRVVAGIVLYFTAVLIAYGGTLLKFLLGF